MRALVAADIVSLWEAGRGLHHVDQGLMLLAAALPGRSRDELAALPLGRRDAWLLALRQVTFGDRLSAGAACPGCGEHVEIELSCRALEVREHAGCEPVLEQEGLRLALRPLNSFDLAAAAMAADAAGARRILMTRCVVEARRGPETVPTRDLPGALAEAIGAALLAADPGAERLLRLGCPACGTAWQAVLDIVQILWSEIAARARRLLMDVHLIARAYGWSEPEILALGEARRGAYLQMVTA